jgi:hypothetical protein
MVAASKIEVTDQITSPYTALISFVLVNTENIDKNEFHQAKRYSNEQNDSRITKENVCRRINCACSPYDNELKILS